MSAAEIIRSAVRLVTEPGHAADLRSHVHAERQRGHAAVHASADRDLERELSKLKETEQALREAADARKADATTKIEARRVEIEHALADRLLSDIAPHVATIGENPRTATKAIHAILTKAMADTKEQLGGDLDGQIVGVAFLVALGRPSACGNRNFNLGLGVHNGLGTVPELQAKLLQLEQDAEALCIRQAPSHDDTEGRAVHVRGHVTHRGRSLALQALDRELELAARRGDVARSRDVEPIGEVQTVGGTAKPMRENAMTTNDPEAWR